MSYLFKSRSEQTPLTPASSEEQLAKINEVRELLCNLPMEMPKFLSDATIRRFLRARNWSTVQAAKSLKEAASWRRQYKPEKICWTKTSERDHIKYLVYNLENLVLNSEGAQEESVVWMSDFRSTPFSLTQESLHIIQKYYPGLIAVAILTNPPRIFESFWKIVKHFLEPKMNKKVKFVYNNNSESLRIMGDMFDLDKLESTFGGRNTAGLDINKYAEKMRRRDQMRGAWTQANGNTCSS
ncbi:hypothetical protein PAHAL_3G331800 [Panicum hallii]|uniref:CRAL-TRIO domain-containing protein n=1 Tax=Panicum hallii TaxID=206008 RepID=A0A2T8KKB6_9POAL|nr:phosphatidylinositol transfer protein 3-like isoform X1 [Panicum hallii]PVH62592.1 hypothetical protein PAHAL_3G331800 [Panicum hallii]